MRAIIVKSPDELEYGEVATPVPGARDVLIKVAAAGVNRADTLQRKGKYPPPAGASPIMGMEVAGEITVIGKEVLRWKVGDKVCALIEGGGYAEYAVAFEGQCLPAPGNLSMVETGALIECIATVWANVFEAASLKANEILLVHGGSSGIGTTAIQMAKLWGAVTVVTAGSDEKCTACKKLGALMAINYNSEDFVAAIKKVNQRGVDVVLDMIGGDYVARNIEAMAPYGRHISIATQHGASFTADMRQIMQKRISLSGSTMRGRPAVEKARLLHEIEQKVWPWVVSGQFKPLISKTFSIKDALEAHKMMESSAHIGKIVLEVA